MPEVPMLDVHTTVGNLKVADYLLNRGANKIKYGWLQHAIQIFSYATHPVDLIVQSAAYPILRIVNPFITPIINLVNGEYAQASLNALAIIPRLAIAPIKICYYEVGKSCQLAWSILGLNTAVNVYKGKKQTESFFYEMQMFKQKVTVGNENSEFRFLTCPRKGISLPVPKKYTDGSSDDYMVNNIEILAYARFILGTPLCLINLN